MPERDTTAMITIDRGKGVTYISIRVPDSMLQSLVARLGLPTIEVTKP